MDIIWSNEAKVTFDNIINDLLNKWGADIALDFESRTTELLNNLLKYKKLCPASKKHKKLRCCVLHKNNSLIYKTKGNIIELITFYDNRSNHKY